MRSQLRGSRHNGTQQGVGEKIHYDQPMRMTTPVGYARRRSYGFICGRIAISILLGLGLAAPASAHCIIGNRFFPATLIVDDPCVNDELSIPTIAAFKNGDVPSAQELDISGEYSKTITPNFGVSFGEVDPSRHSP